MDKSPLHFINFLNNIDIITQYNERKNIFVYNYSRKNYKEIVEKNVVL